ncbi:hypothetical protein AAF712_002555 [Marasmius tenuissimus]|uniref:Uncharacterized protein n=1 Tax=Marasmius tenuissimus TaxID=585030 RepID=A0ABR3A8R4_9AGAR
MKAEFLKDEGYDSMFQLGIQLTLGIREIFAVAAYDIETLSASELQRRADVMEHWQPMYQQLYLARHPNTQNSHQQGNLTSTSAEPNTALPSGTPPVTRKPNVGTIIGAVLGALALLILVLLVILYCRRRRKIHQDKRSKPAVEPTTAFRSCFWRRDRDAEGSCQRDGDAGAVSSYTVAGPGPGSIPEKRCLDVPASYVAPQETEDRGTDTPESVGVDQPNMDVYLRLDMMSRDLADLRRMMHDARGLEEALPEYSSQ